MASSDDELLNTAVPSSNVGSRQSEELVEPSGPDNCSLESESSLPRMNNEEGLSNLDEHLQSLEVRSRILACWKSFKSWLRPLVVVSVPLLLLPLPITLQNSESRAAYAILIIAIYWITSVCPIVVTSLLPLVLFPALGVLTSKQAAATYLKDTNMLFLGGLMVAVTIEKWNLHKRIALWVLMLVGSKPKWLLFGFMATTAFLSMWLSNTATSAMMLPIAQVVIQELREESKSKEFSSLTREESKRVPTVSFKKKKRGADDEEVLIQNENEREKILHSGDKSASSSRRDEGETGSSLERSSDKSILRLGKALMIGTAYAANIGGIATLTGTGPNLVLRGDVASIFPGATEINFGLWFVFGLPTVLIILFIAWSYLAIIFCDDCFKFVKLKISKTRWQATSPLENRQMKAVLKMQYKGLGPVRYAEVLLLVIFVILALLWFTREPKFVAGWGALFPVDEDGASYVSDATTAFFIVFLLFIMPSKPCLVCSKWWRPECRFSARTCMVSGESERLLDWDTVQHKLPWNVVLLLGSGFAMAKAAECSGLSEWISFSLQTLRNVPPGTLAFIICCAVSLVTEVMSNVATTTLFLPILAQLAVTLSINPLYLMLPATVSASLAFMLPVATPPNAIAYSYGLFKAHEMVLLGILMNILSVAVVNFALNTYGSAIFKLNTYPSWADFFNTTNNNCLQTC